MADWREDPAWRTYAGLHRLLLRLAGHLPDDMLGYARGMLAAGGLRHLPDALAGSLAELGVPIAPAERDVLAGVPAALDLPGGAPPLLARVPVVAVPPPAPRYRFAPVPGPAPAAGLDLTGPDEAAAPGHSRDDLTDITDDLVADALAGAEAEARSWSETTQWLGAGGSTWSQAGTGGATGVWRAWRYPPEAAAGAPVRVYLAEVSPGVPAWQVAGVAQRELAADGEDAPRVEVYWAGDDLARYHRDARTHAALLWAREPGATVRLAPGYDGVDAAGRPRFDPEHPRITDPAQRDRLLARLDGGVPVPVPLPSTAAPGVAALVDVVEPARGAVVPAGHRTDGRWVWPEAAGYYLARYGLAPHPDLLRHLLVAGDPPYPVDGVGVFRAGLAVAAAAR